MVARSDTMFHSGGYESSYSYRLWSLAALGHPYQREYTRPRPPPVWRRFSTFCFWINRRGLLGRTVSQLKVRLDSYRVRRRDGSFSILVPHLPRSVTCTFPWDNFLTFTRFTNTITNIFTCNFERATSTSSSVNNSISSCFCLDTKRFGLLKKFTAISSIIFNKYLFYASVFHLYFARLFPVFTLLIFPIFIVHIFFPYLLYTSFSIFIFHMLFPSSLCASFAHFYFARFFLIFILHFFFPYLLCTSFSRLHFARIFFFQLQHSSLHHVFLFNIFTIFLIFLPQPNPTHPSPCFTQEIYKFFNHSFFARFPPLFCTSFSFLHFAHLFPIFTLHIFFPSSLCASFVHFHFTRLFLIFICTSFFHIYFAHPFPIFTLNIPFFPTSTFKFFD